MCFNADAQPPELPADLGLPPISGGAGAGLVELESADGARFSAALAESPEPRGPGVVIFPDVRGLYGFYTELAERFAQAGHHAIAFDYFGRTAGLGPRDDEFDYSAHMEQLQADRVQADAVAAVAELNEETRPSGVASVGFCYGGAQSFLSGTNSELALDGVVGFYGLLGGGRRGLPSLIERAPEMRCAVLGLFGGADQAIPTEDVEAFELALGEAGVDNEIVTYPGAPHSFFDKKASEWAEASDDAWRRVISFLGRIGSRTAA
jgi:carboxymethylenebutenolidase